ncbi:signal peptidase I [Candidatus Woesearchaeota archaeon]|nr:signal peptidase I [Candidatus Woesearchaeota archaeon]
MAGSEWKQRRKKVRKGLHKAWYFIWEDDSWASWFVNIILAFILIKFIVYPVLGLLLATSHPIVAVVSSSMEHDGSFDDWWSSSAICGGNPCVQSEFYDGIGIPKEEFREYKFRNGFNKGDIMILFGTKPNNIDEGDVIVFIADRPDPIIHRVVRVQNENNKHIFSTKGDHNEGVFYFENQIHEDNYLGRAVIRIPFLGYIKIGFVKLLQVLHIM